MSGSDIEARARANQEQNLLVQQLRDSGHDSEADRLGETYHAREMSALASDVYLSAKNVGEPPAGWTRATSDPGALRAAGFNMSDEEIMDLLQPPQSGFRAEIYLPDKQVLGAGARPVVVYKGSTGEIVDPAAPGGRRESGGEDFLNNGQQGIGMRSDYYDRAMGLATQLNDRIGSNFEIAGHSLGGGMASAASAVTGARATTFNAAGLHPETPARFAKENGLPTFNTRDTVHTYQTSGEVLNDVQNGLQRLSDQQRASYGLLANEVGLLMREPMMEKLVGDKLREMMPAGAQTSAAQFVEQLATKPGQDALRNIPVAAGRLEIMLDAKTRDAQGNLVDRTATAAPSQVAELAGPLSAVLHAGAQGMRVGRVAGEQVERVGAGAGHVLDKAGDAAEQVARVQGMAVGKVVDMGSATLQVGIKGGATVIAEGRQLTGLVESTLHRVEGRAQSGALSIAAWGAGLLGRDDVARDLRGRSDAARTTGDERAAHATRQAREDAVDVRGVGQRAAAGVDRGGQWVAGAVRDGYATAGAHIDKGYDFAGYHVKHVTAQAPAVLASVGGATAAITVAAKTHVPTVERPLNVANLAESAVLMKRLGPAFAEAADRHGMDATVIPSMDAELIKQEAAARTLLQQHQRIQQPQDGRRTGAAAETLAPRLGINDPNHPDYSLFKGAQNGVHGLDAHYNRTPDLHSDQLAGALAAKAKQEGLQSIERVVLSEDRARAFAVDTPDLAAVNRQLAHVEVATGRQQPLSVSTEQAAEVDRQHARSAEAPQLVASVAAEQQGQEQQQAARRMG